MLNLALMTLCLMAAQLPEADAPVEQAMPGLFGERLRFGGWYDVQLSRSGEGEEEMDIPHLFLFADAELNARWRAFAEIAYRKAPAFVNDDKGDTKLERAYLEYRHGLDFKLRAGKLNTPAGLWKQLQWSIMVDTNRKPLIEELMFIPNHYTGLSLLGKRMLGDVEFNYEGFLARDQGHVALADEGSQLSGGVDLNLTFAETNKFGTFFATYRNPGDGRDTSVGNRNVFLFYSDVHIVPHRLTWRSEYLQMTREDQDALQGLYTRILWHWRKDLFSNYRYDDSEEPFAGVLRHHKIQTATLGYWPMPWLRTRVEYARHKVRTLPAQRYDEWSLWMGLLF